ncbi:hypothetical protein FF80_03542 [Devosia sp. LC5]|nr:hypothetical protein FF80_03542 [Devosia sp. LC5]
MASSTRRPRAMIRAPSETRCSEMPMNSMNTKTSASTIGIEMATTSPARKPRLRKLTTSAMTTASNRDLVKPPTASSTTWGWSDTWSIPTPCGCDGGIGDQRQIDRHIMGHASERSLIDIEHSVARAILRQGQHRLAAADHLPRLHRSRQDNAIGIGFEIDIGQHFIGRCLLRLGGCQRTLGTVERRLALFELSAGQPTHSGNRTATGLCPQPI